LFKNVGKFPGVRVIVILIIFTLPPPITVLGNGETGLTLKEIYFFGLTTIICKQRLLVEEERRIQEKTTGF